MKVKIKTWGRMVEEFGTDSFGVICCVGGFYDALEKEMPKDRIIYVEDNYWNDWFISKDMIECVIDEPAEETGIKHGTKTPVERTCKNCAHKNGDGCGLINTICIWESKGTGIKHDNGKPPVGYESLQRELDEALRQASSGKGKERHADDEPFERQKIVTVGRWLKGNPAASVLFQAVKKILKSSRLEPKAALRELAGAINYTAAGMIIIREELDGENEKAV